MKLDGDWIFFFFWKSDKNSIFSAEHGTLVSIIEVSRTNRVWVHLETLSPKIFFPVDIQVQLQRPHFSEDHATIIFRFPEIFHSGS